MSEAPVGEVFPSENGKVGPDVFGYYACEVSELLSKDEDPFLSPLASEIPKGNHHGCLQDKRTDKCTGLFIDGIGSGLSDLRREKLKALLRQCAKDLSAEVDGMLEQVLGMCRLQSQVRINHAFSNNGSVGSHGGAEHILLEKPKASSSSSPPSVVEPVSPTYSTCGEEDNDLRLLMESDIKEVEKFIKKYSDELLVTLENMEQQLEKLLGTVMSTCRSMTHREKRDLQKLIQKLPSRNLDRVVEIIQQHHAASETESRDELFVDLEREDNATLWRLFFYVEAVKNARKLVG